jgi:hypothetical protein
MKKIFSLFLSGILIVSCIQSTSNTGDNTQVKPGKTVALSDLFTLTDAEKILGEPAHLKDSSTSYKNRLIIFQTSFEANEKKADEVKTGVIYILAEEYDNVSSAHNKYISIKKANEGHEGIKTLENHGDEAYFHSDYENFYFVMIRKDARVFTMKVNKITTATSLDEFNAIAKKIADTL